ncbi:HepT-like ribonuclease domain-containing protein [Parapedobacter defluvii]
MNDLRNRIIHHYFGIDYDIVWDTVVSEIPLLQEYMTIILDQEKA